MNNKEIIWLRNEAAEKFFEIWTDKLIPDLKRSTWLILSEWGIGAWMKKAMESFPKDDEFF